ncbi:hypothetical protein ACYZT3_17065 [Pseudomonas sp. MDT1-16]|uniref:hypothetical protein n=1 Tax=Pseudomonas sp. AL03 TaxID=3042230 RepID=UPI00249BF77F|nr:hypothetical protein [Pseudomonas sp. AL03]MDI3271766.1 hypothetical protein [Pseudomonas sp. AL03]
MRPTLVIKFVLFSVILNGTAVASVQATSLPNEINRISKACEGVGSQLGKALEEHPSGAPLTVGSGLRLASSIAAILDEDQPNSMMDAGSGAGSTVNTFSCDGLMAAVTSDPLVDKELAGGSDSYINQPNAVPLQAAAWLFSSALFGFIVVANRRKV